jgi:hypothetical protein
LEKRTVRQSARNSLLVVGITGLFLLPADALASVLVKLDAKPDTSLSVMLDLETGGIAAERSPSSPVVANHSFTLADDALFRDLSEVADADQLLAQAKSGDVEIVIYRDEHNSWLNPLRAIAGHPKQISRVYVRAYKGNRLLWTRLIFKGQYKHEYRASIGGGPE